jgi:putative membrane protein
MSSFFSEASIYTTIILIIIKSFAIKMLAGLAIALLLGIAAGTAAGLIPGIHVNLIGASLVPSLLLIGFQAEPVYLIVFVASMAITQTFVDFIPSVFLGAPDEGTELSILPGHQLLKKGQGFQAVVLTCYGSLSAVVLLAILAVPFIFLSQDFMSSIYGKITLIIPALLALSSLYLISNEEKRLPAFFVFSLTGVLGLAVLNMGSLEQPLLPLLTGLFGSSTMFMSIKSKTKIPKQEISMPEKKIIRPLLGALVASPLCGFLPGLGAGQAAIIGNSISKTDTRGFLVLLGATNTFVMGISFIALYLLSKTRTGAAATVQQLTGNLDKSFFFLVIMAAIAAGIISYFLTIWMTKKISSKIEKINYTVISIIVICFLAVLVTAISGFLGLLVMITSTMTGIYCISSGVRRTNMMGCLVIPTLVLYLI